MRVGFISSDWHITQHGQHASGSAWYRCALPASYLRSGGIEAVHASRMIVLPNGWLAPVADNGKGYVCDIVVLQRWMHREGPRLITQAREAGQVVINDVDDWFEGLDPRNKAYKSTDPSSNSLMNREHYRKSIAASSLVTTSTPFLAEQISSWGVETRVLRNCIDLQDWPRRPVFTFPQLTVGWVGATSYRSGDLEEMKPWINDWLESTGSSFHHSGVTADGPSAFDALGVTGSRSASPIAELFKYPANFMPLDVGMVPLRMCDFNEAKSAIKGLEYTAAGVPFVASATAEYRHLAALGIGVVAETSEQWVEEFNRLLDPHQRRAQADRSWEAAKQFDIAEQWTGWAAIYADATL